MIPISLDMYINLDGVYEHLRTNCIAGNEQIA